MLCSIPVTTAAQETPAANTSIEPLTVVPYQATQSDNTTNPLLISGLVVIGSLGLSRAVRLEQPD